MRALRTQSLEQIRAHPSHRKQTTPNGVPTDSAGGFESWIRAVKARVLMAAPVETRKSSRRVAFEADEAQTQSSAVQVLPGQAARSADVRPSNPSPLTRSQQGRQLVAMEKKSLTALARNQLDLARAASSGRSATTVYGGHEHILRQTMIAIASGHKLDDHANPGEATVHVLHGRVTLATNSTSWEGTAGDLLIVPNATQSLEALEDAVVLLTVAKALQ